MNSKKLVRMVVSFIAIIGCVAFVVLSMLNFDLSRDTVLSQLIAVVIFLLFIIGLAGLTGFLIHKISNRHHNDEE
ncbi:MAG: hypothetical protein ACRBCS_03615 [Cellvibrionaceae bacterium]